MMIRTLAFLLITLQSYAQSIPNAIVVGGVTHESARLWIRLEGIGSAILEISSLPDFSSIVISKPFSTSVQRRNSALVDVGGLQPSTRYYYRVVDGANPISTFRSFETFPLPESATTFSFAFGSCQQSGRFLPSGAEPGNVFREIINHQPEFFLQLGDWGYPDTTHFLPLTNTFFAGDYERVMDSYLTKFDATYPMDSLLAFVPVDYVYDDHDFMANNASATTSSYSIPIKPNPLGQDFIIAEIPNPQNARENSIRGYREFMPTYPLVNDSRGIYHSFRYGNVEVFMLDLRAQRSPNHDPFRKDAVTQKWVFDPKPGHSILGRETSPGSGQSQMDWLLEGLKRSTATWKFIASSVPFNAAHALGIQAGIALQDSVISVPGYSQQANAIFASLELADKWAGFPEDIDRLLAFLRTENIRNVIVLSGDSHTAALDDGTNAGLPEIMAGGLDITNSKIISIMKHFGVEIWNRGGQGLSTDAFNNAFGKVTVNGEQSVTLELIDEFGDTFAAHTITNAMTSREETLPPESVQLRPVFPNPSHSIIHLAYSVQRPSSVTMRIVDVFGRERIRRERFVQSTGWNEERIAVNEMPSGVYLIQFATSGKTVFQRIRIVR